MSSIRALLVSAILATAAFATEHGEGGSGGGGGGGSGMSSWDGWSENNNKAPSLGGGAAASCPAGCIPIPTGAPPPAATGAGQLIVQVVSVADANGSLKYFPNKIDAPVGSIVQFQFHPKVCFNQDW
jgi:hypothetical protein